MIAEQRHAEKRAKLTELRRVAEIIFGVIKHITNVLDFARYEDPTGDGAPTWPLRRLRPRTRPIPGCCQKSLLDE